MGFSGQFKHRQRNAMQMVKQEGDREGRSGRDRVRIRLGSGCEGAKRDTFERQRSERVREGLGGSETGE